MNDEELCYQSAAQLAASIRDKTVSPREVTEAVLARIERLNPALNAYCTSMADEARRARDKASGQLEGVLARLKDEFGCDTVKAAERKAAQLTREAAKAEQAYDKAATEFDAEWGEQLGNE